MEYRVIVAHPGRQHSFRLASALKKEDMLLKYVTTVYDKDSSLLMKFTKLFLSKDDKKRADGRKNRDLEDQDVIQYCELSGMIDALLVRMDKCRKLYIWWRRRTADRFGRKVADLAIRENADAVIMYDSNATVCFDILKKKAPHILRIMDTSIANRLYMKEVFKKDEKICPQFVDTFYGGKEDQSDLLFRKEIEDTEVFLAPSRFVKKSLKYSGVQDEQIDICPYGANFSPAGEKKEFEAGKPLEAIFVGYANQRKGIFYLLEAVMSLPGDLVHLTVVGNYVNTDNRFDKYMDRVTFTGRVPHEKVKQLMKNADVYVFPSLGEGLSLSVLEALACGLPCIVSENSGANDAIEDYVNGFEIPVQDIGQIKEKLLWFAQHRDRLPEMSEKASETALTYSWENYSLKVQEIIKNRIDEKRKNVK